MRRAGTPASMAATLHWAVAVGAPARRSGTFDRQAVTSEPSRRHRHDREAIVEGTRVRLHRAASGHIGAADHRDVQNDFTVAGAPGEVAGTLAAVPAMRRVVTAFRQARLQIVHVVRLYHPDGSNADLPRREQIEAGTRLVAPGTAGARIVDGLGPDGEVDPDGELLLSGRLQSLTTVHGPRSTRPANVTTASPWSPMRPRACTAAPARNSSRSVYTCSTPTPASSSSNSSTRPAHPHQADDGRPVHHNHPPPRGRFPIPDDPDRQTAVNYGRRGTPGRPHEATATGTSDAIPSLSRVPVNQDGPIPADPERLRLPEGFG